MSNSKTKREKQYARVDALYKQLMGKYPIFRQYKTLKIGFKGDLITAIHNSELFAEKSVYIIELFLQRYTRTEKYLKNALKFKSRYNIDDEAVDKINTKDLKYYSQRLKEHKNRRAVNAKRNASRLEEEKNREKDRLKLSRPTLSLNR